MKLKDRLAINFTLISTGMLLVVLCSVYFIFYKFLQADFYERLNDRTMVTAKLYLEADEISRDALHKVRSQYLDKLNDEVIRIYNSNNKATFIGDTTQYWTNPTINKVRNAKKLAFKDGERQVVGIFYKDNQGDFVILASATDQGSIRRLSKLFKIMVITFIAISLALLLVSRFIANRILRPLDHFIREVKKVGSSNMGFRVKETATADEIDLLAKSFNRLMEELEQAFILQKTFVANASHELRTPLTRVMMSSELALSKERQPKDYQDILNSILEDTTNMESTIASLLTLAKIDLELGNTNLSEVNATSIIINVQHEWEKRDALKLLVLNELEKEHTISANQALLMIAINNIIGNAFKFSNNQLVTFKATADEKFVYFSITDKGIGIADEDLSEIFKPFYSQSAKVGSKGDGMGLYLSTKITNSFGGELKVSSKISAGTTFTINLPRF